MGGVAVGRSREGLTAEVNLEITATGAASNLQIFIFVMF